MNRNLSLLAALAITVAIGLTGCRSDDTDPAKATPATSSSAVSPSVAGANETDAVAFAKAFWTAFNDNANAGLNYDQWWAALKPLLTPNAAAVHVYDDPRTFPKVTVTGDFSEAPEPPDVPGVTAEVYVPTNEGRYSLYLSRADKTAPWRLEGIGFPEGAQG